MKNPEVRFSAVGDIALGDHPLCIGFGAHSTFKDLPVTFPFQHVLDHLRKADILFGNLECPLSEKALKRNDYKSVQMRGKAEYVKGLVEAGFKVLNLANNHSMQHGRDVFLETVSLLERHGIQYCGVNGESHSKTKPTIFEMNGMKLGFLGYSLRPRQYFTFDPLYSEGTLAGIDRDIDEVRHKVDTVIVSLHWGEEFIGYPAPEEIEMGRRIIEMGGDLIIGHHPHVLRRIERYRHGIIAYSLGNFVCDMIWDQRLRESLIFSCRITKQGIQDIELTPVYINDRYQPEIMDGRNGEILLSRIGSLSGGSFGEASISAEKGSHYLKSVREAQSLYRMKSRRFFIARLCKYPVPILAQIVLSFMKNRVKDFSKQTR